MTQEELDAMMNEGNFEDELLDDSDDNKKDESSLEFPFEESGECELPPVACEDNRVVHQLDRVTQDSEIKATEIFDRLEDISQYITDIEKSLQDNKGLFNSNIELFDKLSTKYDSIDTFKTLLTKNKSALENTDSSIESIQTISDEIMMIMDTMQYQDIHRQKIERVINTIRALTGYMNSLFHSEIDDDSRVSSAQHIDGDSSQDDVVNEDEIEALLASFNK
jgi:flagellar biosynthesis/type III secretory pathway chaperone